MTELVPKNHETVCLLNQFHIVLSEGAPLQAGNGPARIAAAAPPGPEKKNQIWNVATSSSSELPQPSQPLVKQWNLFFQIQVQVSLTRRHGVAAHHFRVFRV